MNSTIAGFIVLLSAVAASAAPMHRPPSPALVSSLKSLAKVDVGASAFGARPGLEQIARFDPERPFHRMVVGQLGLSEVFGERLRAALASGDRAGIQAAVDEIAERYGAGEPIERLIKDRAASLFAKSRTGTLSLAEVEEAERDMLPFEGSHPEALAVLRFANSARSTIISADAADAAAALGAFRASLSGSAGAEASSQGEAAEARAMVASLLSMKSPHVRLQHAQALVDDALAKGEEYQRIAARGLVAAAMDDAAVVLALGRLGLKSPFSAVKMTALEWAMHGADAADRDQYLSRITILKGIGGLAQDRSVREEAVRRMKEAAAAHPEHAKAIEAGMPVVDGRAAAVSVEVETSSRAAGGGFWKGSFDTFRRHPFGGALSGMAGLYRLLQVGFFASAFGAAGMLLASGVAAALLGITAATALRTGHPIAAVFQTWLIGGFLLVGAMTGSFTAFLGAAVVATLMTFVAERSTLQNWPFWGWVANVVLGWIFSSLLGS